MLTSDQMFRCGSIVKRQTQTKQINLILQNLQINLNYTKHMPRYFKLSTKIIEFSPVHHLQINKKLDCSVSKFSELSVEVLD